jgi:hypothetical protein
MIGVLDLSVTQSVIFSVIYSVIFEILWHVHGKGALDAFNCRVFSSS